MVDVAAAAPFAVVAAACGAGACCVAASGRATGALPFPCSRAISGGCEKTRVATTTCRERSDNDTSAAFLPLDFCDQYVRDIDYVRPSNGNPFEIPVEDVVPV